MESMVIAFILKVVLAAIGAGMIRTGYELRKESVEKVSRDNLVATMVFGGIIIFSSIGLMFL